MRKRAFILFGLAAVFAGMSVFVARSWLDQQIESQVQQVAPDEQAVPMTTVVVASGQLGFGNQLRPELLREVDWPADSLPPGTFKTVDELLSGDEPRVVLRRIETNEPVLASNVSGFGNRAALSAVIPKDMRAVTIRVNDVHGVAGFVMPGDRVDVLLTRRVDKDRQKLVTDVLLQNMRVLGVDQDASDSEDTPSVARSVTLEVTPRQSQKLTLAAQIGTLTLALRNDANFAAARLQSVTLADLNIGGTIRPKPPEVAKAPPPAPPKVTEAPPPPEPAAKTAKDVPDFTTVTVIRGIKPSTEKVPAEQADGRVLKGMPAGEDLSPEAKPASIVPGRELTAPVGGATETSEPIGEPINLFPAPLPEREPLGESVEARAEVPGDAR